MKTKHVYFLVTVFFLLANAACDKDNGEDTLVNHPGDGVTDVEGNFYQTVIIGKQEWTTENLRTTTLNDGQEIINTPDDEDWLYQTAPAYSWYENHPAHASGFGALYNWFAIDTGRLCPAGWRVPTDEDWKILEGNVDSEYGQLDPEWDREGHRGYDAGAQLKSTSGWDVYGNGINGFDSFGFTALPAGFRASNGFFSGTHGLTQFWLADDYSEMRAWRRILNHDNDMVARYPSSKASGYSVRCIRSVE